MRAVASPLDGLRVLDIGTLFPAPLTAAMLGDLGADVIKVEPPGGDTLRSMGAKVDGQSLVWAVGAKAKALIKEAGYKGEKVVVLSATDQPIVHSQGLITVELLKSAGINAELAANDWGTLISRRAVREPIDKGGWNIFHTWLVGPDMANPAINYPLRGIGLKSWFGWPTDPKMEKIRDAWFDASDAASQKKLIDEMQQHAWESVPFIPTAQFVVPTAYRSNISGLLISPIAFLWNVEKK